MCGVWNEEGRWAWSRRVSFASAATLSRTRLYRTHLLLAVILLSVLALLGVARRPEDHLLEELWVADEHRIKAKTRIGCG